MSLLIKNGRIITAEQDYIGDVYIEKDKIKTIGTSLSIQADKIIDAKGKYVIPGGIDVHTHLDMPFGGTTSVDNFETGTRAAAFGGTTSLIDFAIQSKGTKMRSALDTWWKKAEGKATIDYGLHMIITDLPEADLNDMGDMVQEGVTSFKLFMAYPNVLLVDDATIFRAMRHTADTGALVCMHAENGGVIDLIVQKALAEGKTAPIYHALTRPTTAEGEAVNRSIALAQMAGAPVYIVHLSSNDALEKVAEARDRGLPAFAETCPQYLFLSLDDMNKPGFEDAKLVFTPPLREKWHQDKLWAGIKKNTLQIVSTDHCPFCFKEQKELGKGDFTKIPNGGPGIEHRMQLLYDGGVNTGRISLNRWIEITSTAPAKMFGMYPRKGTIAPGSDADIVIWNPEKEYIISANTHHMAVDYSMYEGKKVKGNTDVVISRGEVIVEKEKFFGKPGRGNFVKRATHGTAWN
ncbi:MAG: dihydropyrimidinase [Ignavibacteria bacterium RIFOXYB2_FULL_35_12]|nr:MAG: dihydropyrimidinase [Ignavibacteria bacterium GWA2_36_19]OGU51798.1 MAG: dihydropyrimidinase [Ignavibacteria bacterium GWC2_35_8]OGU62729.1 MAG: dihydropyrimidinase [Ignavibacteria bacterium GWF2_35_20]OGU81573.1 MAG: dihydropyrimidinase [Ignavibacteria bacterium RIFOXYA2_FULL_35_9]OGU82900.1 MAG: dihydropyrimidinase [Ignavibacteria bacterium RBG_16_35_7]OGU85700.1 MAG: dihydropyrimidinase [Ignavibacteria bacterium RIFOXYA12_FULL_35_25]OGU89502.1 MAG: dihydropyrimidinase [Ignavibacter